MEVSGVPALSGESRDCFGGQAHGGLELGDLLGWAL